MGDTDRDNQPRNRQGRASGPGLVLVATKLRHPVLRSAGHASLRSWTAELLLLRSP